MPRDRLITVDVADYELDGERRQLVLLDIGSLWTLLDVAAEDAFHGAAVFLVSDTIVNFAEAGDLADAHIAKSIERGQPADRAAALAGER